MYKLRFPRGLYGITPDTNNTSKLLESIEQAAKAGMVALQWRRKTKLTNAVQSQARQVMQLCKQLGVSGIINDNWQLAIDLDADGVHLGRSDATYESIVTIRQKLGSSKIIGVSCYNELERARQMLDLNVNYVAFGAMYSSSVKPEAAAASLDLLLQARQLSLLHARQSHKPHSSNNASGSRAAIVAIGGITPAHIPELVTHGTDSAAVITALFNAPDVFDTATQFNRAFYN